MRFYCFIYWYWNFDFAWSHTFGSATTVLQDWLPPYESIQHIGFLFQFCDCDTSLKQKKSPSVIADAQSMQITFVSLYLQSFEDARLLSCSNKVGLAGFKTLPEWSRVFVFCHFISIIRPVGGHMWPKRLAAVSVSKNDDDLCRWPQLYSM